MALVLVNRVTPRRAWWQKKKVLSDLTLPEDIRIALAQNMHNDLFFQASYAVLAMVVHSQNQSSEGCDRFLFSSFLFSGRRPPR